MKLEGMFLSVLLRAKSGSVLATAGDGKSCFYHQKSENTKLDLLMLLEDCICHVTDFLFLGFFTPVLVVLYASTLPNCS